MTAAQDEPHEQQPAAQGHAVGEQEGPQCQTGSEQIRRLKA